MTIRTGALDGKYVVVVRALKEVGPGIPRGRPSGSDSAGRRDLPVRLDGDPGCIVPVAAGTFVPGRAGSRGRRLVHRRGRGCANGNPAGSGAIFRLRMFAAWVSVWQQADSCWAKVLAVFQGIVWPTFIAYRFLEALAK